MKAGFSTTLPDVNLGEICAPRKEPLTKHGVERSTCRHCPCWQLRCLSHTAGRQWTPDLSPLTARGTRHGYPRSFDSGCAIRHSGGPLARADIYRRNTGEVILGTEGIEPGPGVQVVLRGLEIGTSAETMDLPARGI